MCKFLMFAIWLVMFLMAVPVAAQAEKPEIFKAVVSLQVLCTFGGPEEFITKLLEGYNEKPVYGLDVSTPSGLNIQMYITENRNNPSSTILMHNQSVNKTCIFWSAKDYIRAIETESLPAKKPDELEEAI